MGLIFDSESARSYHAWSQLPRGQVMHSLLVDAIPTLMHPLPGERVLDIGCGEGNHLLLFQEYGLDLYGLDASPYMIRRAKEKAGEMITLKLGKAEDLPFEDNAFDLTLLINTLEFLDDPVKALMEAKRVTRRKVLVASLNGLSWYRMRTSIQDLFKTSLFSQAKAYHLWELKSFIYKVFGRAPVTWLSAPMPFPFAGGFPGFEKKDRGHPLQSPFGPFLVLTVNIRYQMRTAENPLHLRLKRVRSPVINGTVMGKSAQQRGVDER